MYCMIGASNTDHKECYISLDNITNGSIFRPSMLSNMKSCQRLSLTHCLCTILSQLIYILRNILSAPSDQCVKYDISSDKSKPFWYG